MKKFMPLFLCALLLPCLPAQADTPPGCKEADKALQAYLKAIRSHQLPAVTSFIETATVFRIEWLDSTPPKFFTLGREDYLQLLKNLWRFGQEEKMDTGPVRWQSSGSSCESAFTLTEKRMLFGNESGQESQLQLRWENTAAGWRITQAKNRARMW